jgi:predicted TIM-barrel fold metal-dependent hydrolase
MVALFDTHAHLIADDNDRYPPGCLRGQSEPQPLPPPFTIEMLAEQMAAHVVGRACLVQRAHAYGYDNNYVIDCALRDPRRFVAVGVFDAQDARTPDLVSHLVRDKGLGGARLCAVRPWEMDTAWFNSPAAMKFWETAAAHTLPVAIIFFHYHLPYALPALAIIADMFPDLPIIIDHVGSRHASTPEVLWGRDKGFDMDAPAGPDYGLTGALSRLAEHRNVRFKLTQINVHRLREANIRLGTFVRRLTNMFGPDRLIWGSDTGQSAGSYADMTANAREAASELNEQEKALFLFGNAAAIYGDGER